MVSERNEWSTASTPPTVTRRRCKVANIQLQIRLLPDAPVNVRDGRLVAARLVALVGDAPETTRRDTAAAGRRDAATTARAHVKAPDYPAAKTARTGPALLLLRWSLHCQ
jgi:hypothetical protein